ncbi:MAG: hypothetical protein DHS20C01_30810 [marine bacterium B5-7]|nr:MAG: hypothetical protein DHS20C01_30810 [marine bacterium B5-7]
MKVISKSSSAMLMLIVLALWMPLANAASQCNSTPWNSSNGKTCVSIGLDSNAAKCRANDIFAMNCDDTKTQIRTCATETRCAASSTSSSGGVCPESIQSAKKGERKCNYYLDGYYYGGRDARNDRSRDYKRHDDKYDDDSRKYFHEGYSAGYSDSE